MKISNEEWNKRLEDVMLASQDCKTVTEIAEITGYSLFIIQSVLKKFPKKAVTIRANMKKNAKGKSEKNKGTNKRNASQDKKRLNKILKASETCKSFAEISKKTGFSYFVIKSNLAKFPEEEKAINEILSRNKGENVEPKTNGKKEIKEKTTKKTQNNKTEHQSIVMLDTSVVEIPKIFDILKEYVEEKNILGVTDVMLEETANLQKIQDTTGKRAVNMLYIIMDNIDFFKLYEVKHKMRKGETEDEAIIKCAINTEGSLLLTADKEMYIKAILKGGKSRYLERNENNPRKAMKFFPEPEDEKKVDNKPKMVELVDTQNISGKLVYVIKNRKDQFVRVFSSEGKVKEGNNICLEIGDYVYIYTMKEEYSTFADYEVCDIQSNKCALRFSRRIYNMDSLENFIEDPQHIEFIKEADEVLKNKK